MASTSIGCPLEILKIPVPKCDQVFDRECEGKTEIPFTRAQYDKLTGRGLNSPREQVARGGGEETEVVDQRQDVVDRRLFRVQYPGAVGRLSEIIQEWTAARGRQGLSPEEQLPPAPE